MTTLGPRPSDLNARRLLADLCVDCRRVLVLDESLDIICRCYQCYASARTHIQVRSETTCAVQVARGGGTATGPHTRDDVEDGAGTGNPFGRTCQPVAGRYGAAMLP